MKFRWLSVFLAAVLLVSGAAQAVAGQGWLAPESGQTVEVNHALGASATTNDAETDYWGADKAVDGIVNREETNKQNQSRWSTNGARTFEEVQKKDKILTIDMGKVQSFDRLELEWERANITRFKIETAGEDQVYSVLYEKTDDATVETPHHHHPSGGEGLRPVCKADGQRLYPRGHCLGFRVFVGAADSGRCGP